MLELRVLYGVEAGCGRVSLHDESSLSFVIRPRKNLLFALGLLLGQDYLVIFELDGRLAVCKSAWLASVKGGGLIWLLQRRRLALPADVIVESDVLAGLDLVNSVVCQVILLLGLIIIISAFLYNHFPFLHYVDCLRDWDDVLASSLTALPIIFLVFKHLLVPHLFYFLSSRLVGERLLHLKFVQSLLLVENERVPCHIHRAVLRASHLFIILDLESVRGVRGVLQLFELVARRNVSILLATIEDSI